MSATRATRIESVRDIFSALKVLDDHKLWTVVDTGGERVEMTLVNDVAMVMYGVDYRPAVDIDVMIAASTAVIDRLLVVAEDLGIPLAWANAMWMRRNWEIDVLDAPWDFKRLRVFTLEPYDYILTKLVRWSSADREDAVHAARIVDVDHLREVVAATLRVNPPDEPARVRRAWADFAAAVGRPELAEIDGDTQ